MTAEKAIEILSDVGDINRCCAEDAEALDMAIKALEQTRWIPISERLPEDGTWNCFTDGKHISVERYKSDAIDHFFPDGRWFSLEEAVAWMPLPPITPTRPKGRWIDIQYFEADDTYYRPKCPFCNAEPKEYSNYCPNCGADMTELKTN